MIDFVRILGPPLKVGFEIDVVLVTWKVILIIGCIKVIIEGVIITVLALLEVLTTVFYHGAIPIFLLPASRGRLSLFLFFFLKLTSFLALLGRVSLRSDSFFIGGGRF